jgi:hypothetical protein
VAQLVLVRFMRAFVLSICVVMMAGCAETRLKCYIAPRIASIPASGEVPFDVYWINDTDLAIRRTVITQYSFFCNPLPPELSGAGTQFTMIPIAERVIPPHSTWRDQVAASFHPNRSASVAVSGTFYTKRTRFYTNTVVLRKAP